MWPRETRASVYSKPWQQSSLQLYFNSQFGLSKISSWGSSIPTTRYHLALNKNIWKALWCRWISWYVAWKESVSKGFMPCYSVYITSLNWKNYREKKIGGCQGLKWRTEVQVFLLSGSYRVVWLLSQICTVWNYSHCGHAGFLLWQGTLVTWYDHGEPTYTVGWWDSLPCLCN